MEWFREARRRSLPMRKNIFFILLAAPFTVAGFTLNNILRYEGKAFYGMIVLGIVAFLNVSQLVYLFREDADVVEIGARALQLQSLAGMAMPICVISEMLLQSAEQKLASVILSAMRNGALFIPSLLILAHARGLGGIQEAQPLTYVLSIVPTVYFALKFFKKLSKTDKEVI